MAQVGEKQRQASDRGNVNDMLRSVLLEQARVGALGYAKVELHCVPISGGGNGSGS